MDRIDKDNNGSITEQELRDWIKFTKMQYHYEVVNERWQDLRQRIKKLVSRKDFVGDKNVDLNGPISWEMYKTISFGANPGTALICLVYISL